MGGGTKMKKRPSRRKYVEEFPGAIWRGQVKGRKESERLFSGGWDGIRGEVEAMER
jgi:hypothetical protein